MGKVTNTEQLLFLRLATYTVRTRTNGWRFQLPPEIVGAVVLQLR